MFGALCMYISARDLSRDDWIEEFIKRKWSSGLFWAVWAAERKKGSGPIMSKFLRWVFQLFVVKKKEKIFWKHCRVRTEKLHRNKVNFFFGGGSIFYGGKTIFLGLKMPLYIHRGQTTWLYCELSVEARKKVLVIHWRSMP